ncbi:MAG: YgjV family protein [Halieaceae bacterium]
MSDFVLSQLLVGVVLCFDLASFQFRQKRHVLACLVGSGLLMGWHFYLVEAYTASVLGFIAAARFLTAMFSHSRWLLGLFLSLVLANAVISYAGLITLLATLGAVITTTASFLPSDKRFRQLMMPGIAVWIVHNVLAGSPGAVLLETFFLASNMVGYYRFYVRRRL